MGRPRACRPEEVLDRALLVFQSKGYEATSIQDLVRGTGLTRFTIYQTYGDKRGLFLATLDRYLARVRSNVLDLFNMDGPWLPRFRQYLEGLISDSMAMPPKGCLMIHSIVELAPYDAECAALSSGHFTKMEEILINFLTEAQRQGEISADINLLAVARFLLNTSRGIRTVSKVTRDPAVMRDVVDVTMASLANLSGKPSHGALTVLAG